MKLSCCHDKRVVDIDKEMIIMNISVSDLPVFLIVGRY